MGESDLEEKDQALSDESDLSDSDSQDGKPKAVDKKPKAKKETKSADAKPEVADGSAGTSYTTKTSKVYHQYTLEEAWKIACCQKKRTLQTDDQYNFVYASFDCECCYTGSFLLAIGDTDYRKACKETNRWFETDFIGGFAALTAHQSHNKLIQLIHCQHPNSVLSQAECKGIDEDVTHVVSVLHGSGHFAVLVLTLDDKKLEIFDGLGYPLNTWVDHALHILKKCCLVDIDAKCCFRHDRDEPRLYSLRFGDAKWRLAVGQQFFKQTDTYNCGPIACLKIMDLYGRLKTSFYYW